MNRIIEQNADGQLNVAVDKNLFTTIRSIQAWHSKKGFSWFVIIILSIIDVFGFLQIARATMPDTELVRAIIVAGFTASFELAPLYIGYSIALNVYDLGKRVHKLVFYLSISAFVLGFLINAIYRFLTMGIAYPEYSSLGEKSTSEIALPLSLLLSVLPLITSLINMVVGILSYDPILLDIIRIKKQIAVLSEKKRKIDAAIAELNDTSIKQDREKNAKEQKDIALNELEVAKERWYHFIEISLEPEDSEQPPDL